MESVEGNDITIEQVKACKVFSRFTDEQAQEVVDVIKSFTRIVYEHYQRIKEERERKENKETDIIIERNDSKLAA